MVSHTAQTVAVVHVETIANGMASSGSDRLASTLSKKFVEKGLVSAACYGTHESSLPRGDIVSASELSSGTFVDFGEDLE